MIAKKTRHLGISGYPRQNESECIFLFGRRLFFGGVTDNRHLDACATINELATHQKLCPLKKQGLRTVKHVTLRHLGQHVDRERSGTAPIGGIFWCDFSSISPSVEASLIPQIFGHTPTRQNKVKTAQELKFIDVDAGMYRGYGGARVDLEITPEGQLMQHRKVTSKWTIAPLCVHL